MRCNVTDRPSITAPHWTLSASTPAPGSRVCGTTTFAGAPASGAVSTRILATTVRPCDSEGNTPLSSARRSRIRFAVCVQGGPRGGR